MLARRSAGVIFVAGLAGAPLALFTGDAAAEPLAPAAPPDAAASEPTVAELSAPNRYRKGVVVGLGVSAGAVAASGYPNNESQIGEPDFYSASGVMLGVSESVFVLGALTDYLSFGFWYAHSTSSNRHWQSRGDGGGLRVETFPLVFAVPSLKNLGVFAEFGVGSSRLTQKAPDQLDAAGTQSSLGAGAFHEWSFWGPFGGHLAAGPSLAFDVIWSRGFERHGLMAGARLVFYGGPKP